LIQSIAAVGAVNPIHSVLSSRKTVAESAKDSGLEYDVLQQTVKQLFLGPVMQPTYNF